MHLDFKHQAGRPSKQDTNKINIKIEIKEKEEEGVLKNPWWWTFLRFETSH